MFKISEYFYIFTKITISMIMFVLIIIMGFLLVKSYTDVGNSEDFENIIQSISQTANLNKQSFLKVSDELTNNKKSIEGINKKIDQFDKESQNLKYDQQIQKLIDVNLNLQKQIKELQEYFAKNQTIGKKLDNNNIDQVNILLETIIFKFQNKESISDEIKLLEKVRPLNSNHIFEKLYMFDESNFYGFKNFHEEFNFSVKRFIKNKFLEKNQNNVFNFILKFVDVRPSNLTTYEDEDLNKLIIAKKYFRNEEITTTLNKILEIDKNQVFFKKWIQQARLYIKFKSTINQLR